MNRSRRLSGPTDTAMGLVALVGILLAYAAFVGLCRLVVALGWYAS